MELLLVAGFESSAPFLRSSTSIPTVPSLILCSALTTTESPAYLFNIQPAANIYPSRCRPGPGDVVGGNKPQCGLGELESRAGADFSQRVTQICDYLEASLEKGEEV